MFTDLNAFLEIDSNCLPKGKRILIVEKTTSTGDFVLYHLLSLYLRNGHNVCLVGLAQTSNHYKCVSSKIAVNLQQYCDSGRYRFIDGLKFLGSNVLTNSAHVGSPTNEGDSTGGKLHYGITLLKDLYKLVEASVEGLPGGPDIATLLLVDDISVLTSIGCRAFDVAMFDKYLQTLVCGVKAGCMASLIHIGCEADEDSELLHHIIGHCSDILVSTQPLKTGHCRDLNGEISVRWLTAETGKLLRAPRRMHFKISDRNVTLCPLGMSSAVL